MSVLFNRILIALPSDEVGAERLAKLGLSIAQSHHAEARLLSVLSADIPPTPVGIGTPGFNVIAPNPPKVSQAAQRNRKAMAEKLISRHTARDKASQAIRFGNPTHEIVKEAEEWHADMIIVGSRDRNWLERLFDPPLSQNVSRQADCAVLVLPNPSPDSLGPDV